MSSLLRSLGDDSRDFSAALQPLDTDGAHPTPSPLTKDIQDLVQFINEGPAFTPKDLPAYIDAAKNLNGVGIDDRKFLLEKLLTLMARLPPDSMFSKQLQEFVIQILYKDLPHPPSGYLAVQRPELPAAVIESTKVTVPYAFRTADGSDYNPFEPTMGKARSPYARSVPSTHPLSSSSLPAPELVFDMLLKRDKFEEHPGGISNLFFAFADFIIHSVFNTNARDWTQNDVSSYLDLSPLYGSSDTELAKVRRMDGTGRLWDDVFADWRLLNMPPSVGALLVLFNRNHNFIAERLLAINENGKFTNPPPEDPNKRAMQEDELFQRSRLVNCGYFMKVILGDYVGAILGLIRDGNTWRLDPLANSRDFISHQVTPRGEGNVCSIEFNLLYRWHACTSQQDTEWTKKLFAKLLPGLDPVTCTVDQFRIAASKWRPDPDVRKWTFDELQRDENGRFQDGDLAKILLDATEAPAGAYKARGTPEVLRVIELLSIEQGRSWGTCSLNEFRSFMGLKPYASFKEWNPKREIYEAAETLYHDIDNLELHVGMQAEQTKEPMPGAGLCPGYTISRAILADAVALVRGDRFLTVDFTPYNLSAWGYNDAQYDLEDGSFGGILGRLLYRCLPDYYPANSTYGKFPFMVPKTMKKFAAELPDKVDAKYSWTRPAPPVGPVVVASTYAAVNKILADTNEFVKGYGVKAEMLVKGVKIDTALPQRLLLEQKMIDATAQKMEELVKMLIAQNTMKGVAGKTKYIDIVRDVINLAPAHWIANEIIGIPMKTGHNEYGVFRDYELYRMFANVCSYLYLNQEVGEDWTLHGRSETAMQEVSKYLRAHFVKLCRGSLNTTALSDSFVSWFSGRNAHNGDFLHALAKEAGKPEGDAALDSLTASLILEVVPTAPLFSKAMTHVVNFFLQDGREQLRGQLATVAGQKTPQADAEVMKFVYEALRLDPPISSVSVKAQGKASFSGATVLAGQRIVASLIDANSDTSVFPDPQTPNFHRPGDLTGIFGMDHKGLLATKIFERVAPRVLHAIFTLPGLKFGPEPSGSLSRFTQTIDGVPQQRYIDFNGKLIDLPDSLLVQYDS